MNGFETLDELRKRELSGRIILFTVSNYSDDLVNALKRCRWLFTKRYGA